MATKREMQSQIDELLKRLKENEELLQKSAAKVVAVELQEREYRNAAKKRGLSKPR
jgi:ribosomal protein L16 Arg81 hydroxylase